MGIYFATDIDRINNEYMPRLNLEIGRYINYSKLESMLSTQTLFFCNASRFDDEYEGEIPLEFFDGWAQQSEENYRRLNELKSHVYVPYVTCWTPYKTGNTKMWNEYASDNGVCIVSTVRQIFMLSRINGARMYKVHYLDENEQIGNPKKIEFQEAYFGLLFSRLKYAQAQDMRNEQRRVYREMKTVAERANYSEYNESNQLMESVDILHRVFGY